MNSASLKGRLITAATVWIALGILSAGFFLSAAIRNHVDEQFKEELFVHLSELQRLAEVDAAGAHLQRNLSDPRYEIAASGFYWEIQKDGAILARSQSLTGRPLVTPRDLTTDVGVHTHTIDGPTGPLLVAEQAVPTAAPPAVQPGRDPDAVRYIIGTDHRHLDAAIRSFNTTLVWALSGFGLTMVAAATFLILFAMQPLVELRRSLSLVRLGKSEMLSGNFPSEVQPLVSDLNGLLDSTRDLVQRARTQAGNIAHSLKTPLAILTDEASQIEAKGLPQSSAIVLDQCRRMQTQIDYQIARARAVARRATPGMVASARQSTAEVASALSRLHQQKAIVIENAVPDDILVACESQDLNEMIANLVDNAFKHAKSRVTLRADTTDEGRLMRLLIDDDGAGLPPEAFEVVFNIGERWDTQVAGSGLGLAIVRDLARLYGGDVRLGRSALGGLAVTLELPTATAL